MGSPPMESFNDEDLRDNDEDLLILVEELALDLVSIFYPPRSKLIHTSASELSSMKGSNCSFLCLGRSVSNLA